MIKIYHRHPNLIKVINIYYSILSAIFLISFQSIISLFIIIVLFFLLQEYSIKLISKKIEVNTSSTIAFSTFFIGNAYGLGILKFDQKKIIGIHVSDYEYLRDMNDKI